MRNSIHALFLHFFRETYIELPPERTVRGVRLLVAALTLILCWGYIGEAFADEVFLDNGDRLTGEVTVLQDGKATVKTDYAGSVEIQKDHIRKIVTTNPVTIRLDSGETFHGPLSTPREGWISVGAAPGREPVVLSWRKVASINPPPPAWHGALTIGGNLQSGNTDSSNASVELNASRKTSQDRFRLGFLYNYGSENGSVTTRNAYGHFQYNYFLTPAFFSYLGVELYNDHFKNLNLRTVAGPGVGYQIWDETQKGLEVEGGIAYFSEDIRDGEDRHWITARLAGDFHYLLWNTVVFSENFTIYPSLEKTGQYQLRNVAGLTTPMWNKWSLNFKNILERDSDPQPGIKSNDFTWILGLQYAF